VLLREEAPAARQLAAYIVPRAAEQPDQGSALIGDLRRFLRARVPEYMVPGAWALLEALPLTPNGKVDRRALLRIEQRHLRPEAEYVAPQTEAEQAIAAIWCELLGLEQVGIHDNFFDLGGHSLLAVQAHARLRDTFARDLSVVDLFQHPTVSSLAQHISQRQQAAPSFQHSQERASKQQEAILRSRQLMQQRGKSHG